MILNLLLHHRPLSQLNLLHHRPLSQLPRTYFSFTSRCPAPAPWPQINIAEMGYQLLELLPSLQTLLWFLETIETALKAVIAALRAIEERRSS